MILIIKIHLIRFINSYLEILGSYDEEKLLKDLFDNYASVVRPALNDKDTVNVTLGLSLSQIINVVSFCQFFFSINILLVLSYYCIFKAVKHFSKKSHYRCLTGS